MHRRSDRAIGKLLSRVGAVLLLGACSAVLADERSGMAIQHDVVFDSYSPLARSDTLLNRVTSPLLRARVNAGATAAGQAVSEQSIDLAEERFSLYVPTGAAPAEGYGLLVFISPFDKAGIPAGWLPVLARHRLIVVTAAKSGNEANVVDRRMPLALSGYENVRKRYPLDPARVYVGGLSGGSRVALRLALAFPDVFHGALLNAGSDPIGTFAVPLPDAALFRLFEEQSRLVYTTGSADSAVLLTDIHSRDSERDLCFSDFVTLTMHGRGHEATDPATLERAFDALDAPRKTDPHRDACRAARDQELAQRLAGIRKRIDAGDMHGAAEQLQEVDEHFGGLALPDSMQLARELSSRSEPSHTKP